MCLKRVDNLTDLVPRGMDCMSDDPVITGQKEYWHDNRVPAPTASSPAEQATEHPPNPLVTPAQPRAYRNLRHPIASFVIVVIAIILVSVGVLAVTGSGALPIPPIRLANCAHPTSALLGAPGAQFTADFPAGVGAPLLGPAANDWCSYMSFEADGDSARPLDFNVTATWGQAHIDGWAGVVGLVPYWVIPSELQHISLDGASGLEVFRCEEVTDWCYGWLRVSRGRVTWVVSATGNGARLPIIKAFVRSFQPVS
jgi:hypothetical protein